MRTVRRVLLAVLSALLISVAALGALYYFGTQYTESDDSDTNSHIANSGTVTVITDKEPAQVAPGYFETYMNMAWTFPDGKSASKDAIMGNSPNNLNPFWFDVVLTDTDETVYTSDVLKVGVKLKKIVLSTPLDKGTYDAVVNIHLLGDGIIDRDLSFRIKITVQK